MLFISPRVAELRLRPCVSISYRFVEPSAVAYNNTGFYLINTGDPAFLADPSMRSPWLELGIGWPTISEYVARTVVRDVAGGVSIRFYLHDPLHRPATTRSRCSSTPTAPSAGSAGMATRVSRSALAVSPIPASARCDSTGMKLYREDTHRGGSSASAVADASSRRRIVTRTAR